MKCNYIAPEVVEILVHFKETLLVGSETGLTSTGEDLTQDSEYNPW
ncbi:MAG: hypothetical protein IKX71_09055 [Bacteroidales bacterium]|nr:hypothetical protein [Bacteroidales bacterium]